MQSGSSAVRCIVWTSPQHLLVRGREQAEKTPAMSGGGLVPRSGVPEPAGGLAGGLTMGGGHSQDAIWVDNWRVVTVTFWSGIPHVHTCTCCSQTKCKVVCAVHVLKDVFPLLVPPCSVPTPMLPTPTPDQAHRSHRAAWGIQLPPSSRPSTPIRRTGTELHPRNARALSLMLRDRPRSCPPGARRGPRECTVQPHLPPVRPPPHTPFHSAEWRLPNRTWLLGLDLKRKC